ncbi:MAG: acetyl-CoA carboxylase biotin carboxylase subunit [Vulcanimicrobiaceae bacterium]
MARVKRFSRVLIANRGEIAIRIARSARACGLVPLGVFSAADRDAPHVRAMDDALAIGPAAAADSYLSMERIVAAARELGAHAVHPGYGFLSERAEFARAVAEAGLVFIGPTPDAMERIGDKIAAKRRARASGVAVVPGYDGDDTSLVTLRAEAARIGVPLVIKASAGGGGRGMRVVTDLAAFDDALAAARREALAAFHDDRMLLERYLARPRHVEFQILADDDGTTIHLGERECSIQRRHQKIVEEAPSPALDPATRERMGAAAIAVARSVGYANAGTVEFLLDADGAFYFLEMNARLQVEHPVTELVHGVDLVAAQFAIAAGERLGAEYTSAVPRGCAIEVRLNAEDPETGLPATGTLGRFELPPLPGMRYDLGVEAGTEVTIHYDSLLGKIVAYGPDRSSARAMLAGALAGARIDGVTTNLPLLRAIVADPAFRAGETTTAFLHERAASLRAAVAPAGDDALLLAVARALADPQVWRIAAVGIPLRFVEGGRTLALVATRDVERHSWELSGALAGRMHVEWRGDGCVVSRDGRRIVGRTRAEAGAIAVVYDGRTFAFALAPPPALGATRAARASGGGAVTAPMPGRILQVAVRAGDLVAERDLLFVLEAMKMEHRIEATRPGTVGDVSVEVGTVVANGAQLLEFA